MKYILGMINEWGRFSDSKAGILLTLQGVILTIVFTLTSTPKADFTICFVLFVLGILIFGISIVIGLNAILPTLEVGAPSSKIFFGHIRTHKDFSGYLAEVNKTTYSFEEDVLSQIWANSIVAWKKYELVRIAIVWGLTGFVLIGISYILK